jgi:hypothetical protein
MDALEFFKTRKRMCEATKCADCKLYHVQGGCCIAPEKEKINAFEEAIAIVEQWAKEHPIKTRQSEFLKLFPNAPIYTNTHNVALDPCLVDTTLRGHCPTGRGCDICRREFWLAEVEDT